MRDDNAQDASPDMRLYLNKSSAPGTASLIFQDDYIGHAEMGLVGDNNFVLKVSPDGSTFNSALQINPQTGFVGIGKTPTTELDIDGTGPGIHRFQFNNAYADEVAGSEIGLSAAGQALRFLVYNNGTSYMLSSASNFYYGLSGAHAAYHIFIENHEVLTLTKNKAKFNAPVQLDSYDAAALPSPVTSGPGAIIYVTNAESTPHLAYCDGINWLNSQTGLAI